MKIGVFTRGEETHSYKYEKAFAEGLIEHGHDVIFFNWHDRPYTLDLAVMWSIKNETLITHLKNLDTDFVILERGYIGDREKWTSCGFNGLNGRADFCNDWSDDKRLHHVEGYVTNPQKENTGGYTLIMGQVPSDSSVRHIGFHRWLGQTYRELDCQTLRKVFYRPHPLDKEPYIPEGLEVIEGSLADAIAGAYVVITLNSNSGVDAILSGTPCVSMDMGSMVYQIAEQCLLEIALPKQCYFEQWLKNMSYTQWTIEEMSSGETWSHLMRGYKG